MFLVLLDSLSLSLSALAQEEEAMEPFGCAVLIICQQQRWPSLEAFFDVNKGSNAMRRHE
jgi:hypothetical protein